MKLTGHRCRCGGCGEHFSRAANFDKHRTGPYGDRRCMAPDEMKAAGLRLVDGVWKGPPKVAPAELQTTSAIPGAIARADEVAQMATEAQL